MGRTGWLVVITVIVIYAVVKLGLFVPSLFIIGLGLGLYFELRKGKRNMEKAFNIYRESDEKEMTEWLVGNGLEREAIEKIIKELKRCNMDLIDVSVDDEDEDENENRIKKIIVVEGDGTGIGFDTSGEAIEWGDF